MIAIAGVFALRLFPGQMMRVAMVPTRGVRGAAARRRKMPMPNRRCGSRDPTSPTIPPCGHPPATSAAERPEAAVFFIHPTSYLERTSWNAPLDDQEANARAELFLRGQASAFNEVGEIWAPRYRQATFGAFLTERGECAKGARPRLS